MTKCAHFHIKRKTNRLNSTGKLESLESWFDWWSIKKKNEVVNTYDFIQNDTNETWNVLRLVIWSLVSLNGIDVVNPYHFHISIFFNWFANATWLLRFQFNWFINRWQNARNMRGKKKWATEKPITLNQMDIKDGA